MRFRSQIEQLDRENFTIVAWEPPGYGKSRPPDNKTFPDNFHQRDAAWAHSLMKTLDYSKFSLLGFGDGGTTALLLAATYPQSIRKMIVFGARSYIHQNEIAHCDNIGRRIEDLVPTEVCTDYFQKTWTEWVNTMKRLYVVQNGNLCQEALAKIKCPTLIIHGFEDKFVVPDQQLHLSQNIVNSRTYMFKKPPHDIYQKYPEVFNHKMTKFLLEK
ncbi:valacyclovir hydrolase [Ooceraea biroi]|nr:valacyclovir hydrolase [Ooceraea biroi]EZA57346.1 Valacyclovir hydrolase [Ooceraea biroi]